MRAHLAWPLALAPALLAVLLRARDALSDRALGAEDPFTHVAYTRIYLELAHFPTHHVFGQSVYPHGLHALTGAVVAVTGLDPLEVGRWLPAPLGFALAGGVLAALALRPAAGVVAALAAALLAATAPELVVRQSILFPTALVLALLPVVLAGGVLLARGDLRGVALAAPALVALALAHPWSVPFAVALLAGALVAARRPSTLAAGAAVAVGAGLFTAWLLQAANYWTFPWARFADAAAVLASRAALVAAAGFVVVVLMAAAALAARRLGRAPLAAALAVPVLGGAAAAVALVLARPPLPLVDYGAALGPALAALGLVGVALAPWRPRDAASWGALALAAAAFPLTALPIVDSWFVPHRTVVLVTFALAVLGGPAVAALAAGLARLAPPRANARHAAVAGVAVALLVATVPAGATAPTWYRYYSDEEYEGLERLAARLEADPEASAVVASWQAQLVLAALVTDGWRRVDYVPAFFQSPDHRAGYLEKEGWHDVYALYDRFAAHAHDASGAPEPTWLREPPWRPLWADGPHQAVYLLEEGSG